MAAATLAAAQPTLSGISPTSGSTGGGTSVTLTGTGFVSGATVSFGGTPATNVVVVSSTSLTAKTPAHAAGTVGVTVTNPDGTSASLSNSVVQPVLNPGFESGSLHWVFNASGSFAISTTSPHSGTQSATLSAPVGTHPALFAVDASGNRYFPVNAGDSINYGGFARRISGDGLGRWKIAVYDSNKANPVYPTPSPSNVTTSTWTQQTGTYVIPSGKAFITFYCELFSSTVTASIGCDDAILKRTTSGGFTYVSQATLSSITVSPANASLATGSTLPYTATGNYSDGTQAAINTAAWSSTNTAAATINSTSGLAAGVAAGSTTIKATVGAIVGSTGLTVTGNSGSFAVTPRLAPVTSQTQVTFTANTTSAVSWYVDNTLNGSPSVGTIAGGVYTPQQATGSHQIKAVTSGGTTGTAQVVVNNFPGMFTYHYDNNRQGANKQELLLNPSNVRTSTFGKVFRYPMQAGEWLHAQPLYVANVKMPDGSVHNVLYVATEHDNVYAFDADAKTTTPLWKKSFINPGAGITTVPSGDVGTQEQQPEFGVTATPVIDPTPTGTNQTGTIYVLARTKENGSYFFRLHALDWADGSEKFGGPVVVTATVAGTGQGNVNGQVTFNSLRQNARSALLLANGIVYFAMASIEDIQPYHGWVFAYNAQNLSRVGVWNSSPNGWQVGVWNSGGGPAADSSGNVFVVVGNGDANVSHKSYSNSFVKLSPTLSFMDYFMPDHPVSESTLNTNDWDMTSGGPMLFDTGTSNLMLSGGKQGSLYLVDRNNMGGFNSTSDQVVQTLPGILPQSQGCCDRGLWSTPTYWNNKVFLCGRIDVMKVFTVSNGLLSTSPVQTGTLTMTGPTLSVSANGTSNGIVWAVQFDNQSSGGPAILRAWDANNINSELYDSGQNATRDQAGKAVKFSVPTVANGRVYFNAQQEVDVYGPLP